MLNKNSGIVIQGITCQIYGVENHYIDQWRRAISDDLTYTTLSDALRDARLYLTVLDREKVYYLKISKAYGHLYGETIKAELLFFYTDPGSNDYLPIILYHYQ